MTTKAGIRAGRGRVDHITLKQIGEYFREYVGFMVLWTWRRHVIDPTEALWQILRMYDVGGKLLNGIKSIYVNSLACVRVKGSENECLA